MVNGLNFTSFSIFLILFYRLTLQNYEELRIPPNFWDILHNSVINGMRNYENYFVEWWKDCIFATWNFMFPDLIHRFSVQKHVFSVEKHKFLAQKHKKLHRRKKDIAY